MIQIILILIYVIRNKCPDVELSTGITSLMIVLALMLFRTRPSGFMGVCKYTPNLSVAGDMGWKPPFVKQWTSVLCHWRRVCNIDNVRPNKGVFICLSKSYPKQNKKLEF